MGCLRNLIRAVIITLAVVGFMSLGGKELFGTWVDQFFNPPHDVMVERAKKVGDFSNLSDEFELEKAMGIMGYNGVVAEHKATGQKFVVIDSNKKPILTEEDIKAEDVEERLKNSISKLKYQSYTVDELHVTKRGTMASYGKQVPYVAVSLKSKKLPIGEISGVIGVVQNNDGEDRLLISANEKKKYSQLISDEFFRKVK